MVEQKDGTRDIDDEKKRKSLFSFFDSFESSHFPSEIESSKMIMDIPLVFQRKNFPTSHARSTNAPIFIVAIIVTLVIYHYIILSMNTPMQNFFIRQCRMPPNKI